MIVALHSRNSCVRDVRARATKQNKKIHPLHIQRIPKSPLPRSGARLRCFRIVSTAGQSPERPGRHARFDSTAKVPVNRRYTKEEGY